MSENKQGYDFEKSLKDLEQLVERLEGGDISLEESLEAFEQGIKLTRECQTKLSEAEQKVQLLTKNNDGIQTQAFEPEE